MKQIIFFLGAIFWSSSTFCQNEVILPFTYTAIPIAIDPIVMETTSDDFSGMNKVSGINTANPASWPYVYYSSTEKWPDGAWGRGYENDQGISGQYEFYQQVGEPGAQYFRACQPLVRRTAEFTTGHLHLFLSGHTTGNSLTKIKDGIDYLLTQQYLSGGDAGGFGTNLKRTNQFNILTIEEGPDPYETAYGVQALCEYYLSGINYKRPEVLLRIQLGAVFLLNTQWQNTNANVRALGLWALSDVYKIGSDCSVYFKIKELTEELISLQTNDVNVAWHGTWRTGGVDGSASSGDAIFHDTKTVYHMIIIRGLVEAFNVIPSQDAGLKTAAANSVKRAVNNVINWRLAYAPNSSNMASLRYADFFYSPIQSCSWWLHVGGNQYESHNYLEPLIKLTYYANTSEYFTTQERNSLRNLTDRLASQFDDTDKWQFKAMCMYTHYMDAVDNNYSVFDWEDSDLNYESDIITNRVVNGDFDNDGFEDDIAAIADYGSGQAKIHVWKSNGASFIYLWSWEVDGYDATKINGRVVSGDFDNDGFNDDIAAFYDYGNEETKIHLWKSNGTNFSYGWDWEVSGYNCNKITGRVVSGDFDNDGWKDDIAAFYDYGNEETKMHLWKSNNVNFDYSWDWEVSGYNCNKITGRVVSGDFDNDDSHDDIMALYDYGDEDVKMHEWNFNGGNFDYSWAWSASGYTASKVTDRFVSGDFDGDDVHDDISAFYDYGTGGTKQHIWSPTNSGLSYSWAWNSLGYDANQITGRVVSGNFNQGCKHNDIATFYDYGIDNTRTHVWLQNQYQGATSWWLPCPKTGVINCHASHEWRNEISTNTNDDIKSEGANKEFIEIFPNPAIDVLNIRRDKGGEIEIKIYSISGALVLLENSDEKYIRINISEFGEGVYIVRLKTAENLQSIRFVKE